MRKGETIHLAELITTHPHREWNGDKIDLHCRELIARSSFVIVFPGRILHRSDHVVIM